jgi:hypothetical protein
MAKENAADWPDWLSIWKIQWIFPIFSYMSDMFFPGKTSPFSGGFPTAMVDVSASGINLQHQLIPFCRMRRCQQGTGGTCANGHRCDASVCVGSNMDVSRKGVWSFPVYPKKNVACVMDNLLCTMKSGYLLVI